MKSFNDLQQRFIEIRSNKLFEIFVIAVIIMSALAIGAKTYDLNPTALTFLKFFDFAVTLFFLVEIIIRMIAEHSLKQFFKKGWNIFDFIIVTASLIPIDESEMALLGRLLRVFRILRLVSVIPELRILMNALVKSIPRMGYVTLLMFIIFYIYAAVGSLFFSEINSTLWGNISISLLTLFRVATFEDWTDVMYETMTVYPLSWAYYLTFIFLTAFIFLNMMIGIVLDVLQKEHEAYDREHDQGEAGEVHWIREHSESMEKRLIRIESLLLNQTQKESR